MKKMINSVHLEGLLYQHKLEKKIAGATSKNPGAEYIQGTVDIATDSALTNIVQVHYTYVSPLTNKGKENPSYTTLANIENGTYPSVMSAGADKAQMLRIDTAIGVNDFYTEREGNPTLVTAKRNEGGFIHTTTSLTPDEAARCLFETDIVITGTTRKEADEERGLPEKLIVKGAIFDYRNTLLPVEFSVLNPKAMDYFEDLDATSKNPVFTKVKGNEVSETTVKRIEEEGAWGEVSVREVTNSRRDFVITWAPAEPYAWDDKDTILASEMNKAIADREIHLAEVKARYDEYKASKSGGNKFAEPTLNTTAKKDEFKF